MPAQRTQPLLHWVILAPVLSTEICSLELHKCVLTRTLWIFRYLSPAVTRVWSLRVWSWIQAGGWSPVRSLERLCSVWKLPHMKTSFESKPLRACCGLTNHLQLSYFAKYDADSFIMASSLFFLGYRLCHSPGFNVLQFSCHCGKL